MAANCSAMGWQNYVHFGVESDWGTAVSPTHFVEFGEYNISCKIENRTAETMNGRRDQTINQTFRKPVNGRIMMPMQGQYVGGKSIAQHFFDAAISAPASLDLTSFTFERWSPNSKVRHTGCRINQATLSGDAESGKLDFSADMICRREIVAGSPIALPSAPPTVQMANFLDIQAWLDVTADSSGFDSDDSSSAVEFELPLRSLNITVNNNVKPYFGTGDQFASCAPPGKRSIEVQFTIFNRDDFFDEIRRSFATQEHQLRLRIPMAHGGTASDTYTVLELDFPRVSFTASEMTGGLNDVLTDDVKYVALRPGSMDFHAVLATWSTSDLLSV